MRKNIKKTILIFVSVLFLFTATSCEVLTNLINNLTKFNTATTDADKDYVRVTFSYNIEEHLDFSLLIKKGEKIYEPITPNVPGYKFLGWSLEDENMTFYNFRSSVSKDITIIANFTESDIVPDEDDLINVTYNYNLPLVNLTTIKLNKNSKTIEPLVPIRPGYKFLGWHLNDNLFDFDLNVNEDITLKAFWEEETIIPVIHFINVTFNFDNDDNPINLKIKEGSRVIEPKAPLKEGYTFSGWFKNETDDDAFNFQSHLTQDITLTARWVLGETIPDEPTYEDVLVQFNYHIPNVPDAEIRIRKGSKVLEPKTVDNEEFNFIGWFVDLEDSEPYDFNLPVNNNLGLIAKWEKIGFTPIYVEIIFIYYDDNNEININVKEVEKDFPMVEPTSPTKLYYDFIGWFYDDSSVSFDFSLPIDKDYIFTAKWQLEQRDVRVSFMKNNESLIESIMVPLGSKISPLEHEEDPNNIFIGWEDKDGNFFDFEKTIFEETILFAVYYPSFESVNEISKNVIRGNVKIFKSLYNNNPVFSSPISNSIGSGVIVKQVGNVYYVLTNSHVTSKFYKTEDDVETEAPYAKYEVEDFLGERYQATLVLDGENMLQSNVDHDLAILKFTLVESEDSNDLNVISISSLLDQNNPLEQQQILAIVGQPHGQKNTITFGKYGPRKNIYVNAKQYEAYEVSIPGAKGSSGSMVINQDHQIIGIVFAGPANVDFVDSNKMYVVPLQYVHDIMAELEDLLVEQTAHIVFSNYNYNFFYS